eukprot:CAMPEP_0114488420 /NCGR_PEP_ID=MMETSP0109-20121206/1317_1 /TAXON_ID=29199 /ORGANISM="Chlorarachnion reptans, Strain CCCM449" /LENGTH=530 /DNA_ID=CAMNT_0001664805 /DNA_START=6 /DNA_END=1595 /DNA_ORIENTATION=+
MEHPLFECVLKDWVKQEKENPKGKPHIIEHLGSKAFSALISRDIKSSPDCEKDYKGLSLAEQRNRTKAPADPLSSTRSCNSSCASRRADTFQIFVKTLTGLEFHIYVNPSDTVKVVMSKVMDKTGLPIDEQRLIYAGAQLEDHCAISQYNIKEGELLHVVQRLRGGCFRGNTKIALANGKNVAISDIRPGDAVKSFNLKTKRVEDGIVTTCVCIEHRKVIQISFNDETPDVFCTAGHPIWVKNKNSWGASQPDSTHGHLECALLESGDEMIDYQGITHVVRQIKPVSGEYAVFNIIVDVNHNYYANGILVSNDSDPDFPDIPPTKLAVEHSKKYSATPKNNFHSWEGDLKDGKDRGNVPYINPAIDARLGNVEKIGVYCFETAEKFDKHVKGWPILYHGTAHVNAVGILFEGLRTSKHGVLTLGRSCAYFTPSLRQALFARYAKPYLKEGGRTVMQLVLQVRVNPKEIIAKNPGTLCSKDYWRNTGGHRVHNFDELNWLVQSPSGGNLDLNNQRMVLSGFIIRESPAACW